MPLLLTVASFVAEQCHQANIIIALFAIAIQSQNFAAYRFPQTVFTVTPYQNSANVKFHTSHHMNSSIVV